MSRLSSIRFAIVGAGGLGGPIAYALAAAGAGKLLLVDGDVVELSNLQRQVQFTTDQIGGLKVFLLRDELARRGCDPTRVDVLDDSFENNSAAWVIDQADVVIDGSDNFPTKFLVNDRCVVAGRPFVIGAVARYGGQVMAVRPGAGPCYRCLFERPPLGAEPMSCSDSGVLGATVGAIAGETARAAIALATGDDATAAAGELVVWDDLRTSARPRRVQFNSRAECTACGASATLPHSSKEAP